MSKLLLVISLFLSPEQSIDLATSLLGRPDLADDLKAIAWRESRLEPIGVHEVDRHLDGYWGQVKLNDRARARGSKDPGHIDRRCQPHYKEPGMWATHGILGLSAAAHWEYMPRCYKPQWLDIPLVSAIVATRKYDRKCLQSKRRRGWCRIPKRFRGERDPRKNNKKAKATELPPRADNLEQWLETQLKNKLHPPQDALS